MSLVACWFVYWYVLSSGGELEKHGVWKLNCLKILVDKLGQQALQSPLEWGNKLITVRSFYVLSSISANLVATTFLLLFQ
jgi:hypothetical protein